LHIKRMLLIGGAAAVPLLGLGNIAYGAASQTSTPSPAPAVTDPQTTPSQPAQATTPNDREKADSPDAETPETPETPGRAHKTDEPGSHQDPPGANVDHQMDGQE
jgi:hypothetical protein